MKIIIFILLLASSINGHAQSSSPEIISSAGETYKGNSIQIDWTLGEIAITSIQNSKQQITQGFHQSNYTVTSVNELAKEIGQIQLYPNPASDIIEIKLNFDQTRNVEIQLIDLNGKMIWSVEDIGTQIKRIKNIQNLSNGTYFVKFLIDDNQYSQTFKFQKN